MTNLIGQSLGRYLILEQIGEGGMAIVYKARDTRLDRDVAIKVIRTEKLTLETMGKTLKRFDREAKALAKLTHPNIVQITDFGEYDGKPYLVMFYIPGGTLKQKLGQPIPWRDAARLLAPIARALQYAHQQGVIHRDVKPSNILIGANNEPMLTDFGIAKILLDTEETSDLTGTGMGIGTPEYMSPEQFQGEGVDARTDVYSLGVVLYEMITGRKPYQADTPAAVLIKQVTEPLPRPKSFVPDLPEVFEKLLLKALAKNKEDRFQDVAAFGNGLESLLMGMGKEKKPATKSVKPNLDTQGTVSQGETSPTINQEIETENLLHKTRNPTWKNVLWIILGWIIGLAIGGVIGLVVDDAFYGIAETIGWVISWAIGLAIGGTIMIWRLRQSVLSNVKFSKKWLWLLPILILVFLWGGFSIVREERFVVSAWHPDSQSLLLLKTMMFFNNSSSRFYIASDDSPFWMAPFVFSHLASEEYTNGYSIADWSPDGCCLAFSDTDGPEVVWPYSIFVYNIDSQVTTQITTAAFDTSPTWSPDGSKIAFARDWQNIYIVQINGEGLTQITNFEPDYAGGGPSGLDWSPDGSKIAFEYGFDMGAFHLS